MYWPTAPYGEIFRILAARKLERGQKLDEAGDVFLLSFQFTRGQNAENLFVRERLLPRLGLAAFHLLTSLRCLVCSVIAPMM